ncbi:MAG: protein kinase [Gemmatimonadetes bacterium]|nr:protein kinase [Gemmatimonadota bacterium]
MGAQLDRLKTALADRYAIAEEIGSGGMATVYLAEDLKHHRKVAVKVLRPDLAATLGPARFLREIEVAAQLHHPHILPLYDSEDADGFLYYVMPYEEGQSLREKLAREGELPVPEAVRMPQRAGNRVCSYDTTTRRDKCSSMAFRSATGRCI